MGCAPAFGVMPPSFESFVSIWCQTCYLTFILKSCVHFNLAAPVYKQTDKQALRWVSLALASGIWRGNAAGERVSERKREGKRQEENNFIWDMMACVSQASRLLITGTFFDWLLRCQLSQFITVCWGEEKTNSCHLSLGRNHAGKHWIIVNSPSPLWDSTDPNISTLHWLHYLKKWNASRKRGKKNQAVMVPQHNGAVTERKPSFSTKWWTMSKWGITVAAFTVCSCSHLFRFTFLVPGWTQFCLQNCLFKCGTDSTGCWKYYYEVVDLLTAQFTILA